MRALSEDAGKKEKCVVGNGESFLQPSSSEADQIEQMMREAVALTAFVGNGKTVFFPSLVEEGKHAVMKQVEKITQRFIAAAQPRENERRIEMRQRALRAGGAHEIHSERRRLALGPVDGLNFAGGEDRKS